MKRVLLALAIAAVIYGAALGAGIVLYATGVIGTGATHNTCENLRAQIARERGISEEEVPQADVKAATEACLSAHTLTRWEAFRSEYLLWSAWPAAITAATFLAWPAWAGMLERQEEAERKAARGERQGRRMA
jgi:hypothetical protein